MSFSTLIIRTIRFEIIRSYSLFASYSLRTKNPLFAQAYFSGFSVSPAVWIASSTDSCKMFVEAPGGYDNVVEVDDAGVPLQAG